MATNSCINTMCQGIGISTIDRYNIIILNLALCEDISCMIVQIDCMCYSIGSAGERY